MLSIECCFLNVEENANDLRMHAFRKPEIQTVSRLRTL